jgi:hypothetical protein
MSMLCINRDTRYPVISTVATEQLRWKIQNDDGWTLMWNDHAVTM